MSASNAEHILQLKQQAAEAAVGYIEPGMVIGLGSGSTALWALRRIGTLLANGTLKDIRGYPTSRVVETEARRLGIPLVPLEDPPAIDLTIDGADELDPALNMIKGGGGALLREKIVAQLSRREVIVVDDSKLSKQLGTHWPLPVEVLPFAWGAQQRFLESLGAKVVLRTADGGAAYKTDQDNYILDAHFGPINDLEGLAALLAARAGIVEHGLFLGLATDVIVAGHDGIRHLTR